MYNVPTNSIAPGVLYRVTGDASAVYNTITYATGQTFRGIAGQSSFTYSGDGSQQLVEVLELSGSVITYQTNGVDLPVFPERTNIQGMAIEYALNNAEKIVSEVTTVQGFAIELIDFPFYSFEITETRF